MAEEYYNEFFEGHPNLPKEELKAWIEENRRRNRKTFVEYPSVKTLTVKDMAGEKEWQDRAKFYFLPFLINCYRFTRQHRLPHFAIPVSPTCMFYRDRLHLRNFMDTVHEAFFRCLEMCLPKGERIMLLVEKRFHVENPVDGGTQQLYNMLWDVDLSALVDGNRISRPDEVILPPMGAQFPPDEPRPRMQAPTHDSDTSWNWDALNPTMPSQGGIELCRRTLWFMDDLNFLCRRYELVDECACFPEVVDVSKVPDDKKDRWAKTAREFYFKIFSPKDDIDEDEEGEDSTISSDSELDPDELDSTELEMLDSTLDFEQEDEEMKKAVQLLANIPTVTGMTQGMLDLMTSLTRIIPLVIDKVDDPRLKEVLERTLGLLGRGMEKVLKICAFLGIKVQKKPSPAVGWLVKNRFKKDRPDFLTWEIDEMNKRLDELEGIDENPPRPPFKGQIPLGVKSNHMYPQRMPLRTPPRHQPPIVPYPVTQPDHHLPPMPPPKPPKPDELPPEPPKDVKNELSV